MRLSSLEPAALAGAAGGLRSTVRMAALINAGASGLPRQLTWHVAQLAASLRVVGEPVADKLPLGLAASAEGGIIFELHPPAAAGPLQIGAAGIETFEVLEQLGVPLLLCGIGGSTPGGVSTGHQACSSAPTTTPPTGSRRSC
jgi:hypothetical protein